MINAACILCLTCGPTHSWRNGDAQCCQLSNIADPKPYLVSENRRSCCPSPCALSLSLSPTHTHTHTLSLSLSFSLSLFLPLSLSLSLRLLCLARGREEQGFRLNTDIMLHDSLILHASISKITAQLLYLSYVYFISSDNGSIIRIYAE